MKDTPYQRRMMSFVWTTRLYLIAGSIWAVFADFPSSMWFVFFSVYVILHALAEGFDAVYESLKE